MSHSANHVLLNQLNTLSREDFVDTLGAIYEHSPWAAEGTYAWRPFLSLNALEEAFQRVVNAASYEQKLALLQAHPELGTQRFSSLTQHSRQEQQEAGLKTANEVTLAHFTQLNHSYRARHGFPFIIAVAGLNAEQILKAMEQRLDNDNEAEFITALKQVNRIASLRLKQIITED